LCAWTVVLPGECILLNSAIIRNVARSKSFLTETPTSRDLTINRRQMKKEACGRKTPNQHTHPKREGKSRCLQERGGQQARSGKGSDTITRTGLPSWTCPRGQLSYPRWTGKGTP
jgi:hypothetical protein